MTQILHILNIIFGVSRTLNNSRLSEFTGGGGRCSLYVGRVYIPFTRSSGNEDDAFLSLLNYTYVN